MCLSVCRCVCVCLLVMFVSPVKATERINVPFEGMIRVTSRNQSLNRSQDPRKMAIFGRVVRPTEKHCESLLR